MKILEKIPKGWEKKQIKDLLDYERPDNYIVKSDSYTDTAKTPVLTANKSFILGHTDEGFGICNNLPAVIFDDFTTDSKYVDFPFKVKSSAIKILRSKSKDISLKFVFELIKSIHFQATNHKRYYISEYQDIDVIVPPPDEQKKIAEILTTIDKDIKKTDEIIFQTEKVKNGLMQELFTKGIGHNKFKKTKIGEIPEEWDVVDFEKVAVIKKGEQLNRLNLTEFGDYPALNGGINPSGYTDKWNTEADTITISEGGNSCGYVNFNRYRFWCGGHCYAVKDIRKNIDKIFLYQFLKYKQNEIMKLRVGSGLPNIQKKEIESFKLFIPSFLEQQKIANILSSIDEKISVNKKHKEKVIKLKKGLMQDLLSGTVRTIKT
jgi:type I restriction enzyme S subunit